MAVKPDPRFALSRIISNPCSTVAWIDAVEPLFLPALPRFLAIERQWVTILAESIEKNNCLQS
jgi:hypothetical protein